MAKANEFEPETTKPGGDDEDEATLAAIDQGIRDAKSGRTVPIEKVRKLLTQMLDSRYDDISSGGVAPIESDQALSHLRRKSRKSKGCRHS
jgi:hypothetical protein